MTTATKTKTCHTCYYKPYWNVTGYDADGNRTFSGFCKRQLPVMDERGIISWDEDNPQALPECPAWEEASDVSCEDHAQDNEEEADGVTLTPDTTAKIWSVYTTTYGDE